MIQCRPSVDSASSTGWLALALFFSGTAVWGAPIRTVGKDIVGAAGVNAGVCVHLGCGNGELTAELARNSRLLVHGLALNRENVPRARQHIQSQKLYGPASVVYWRQGNAGNSAKLPYADNLVNLVVVDDLPRLLKGRSTQRVLEEVRRVLCPLGTVVLGKRTGVGGRASVSEAGIRKSLKKLGFERCRGIKEHGLWVQARKPWPEEMDDWTHWKRGADGNPVSKDLLVGPPTHIRWMTDPIWPTRAHVTDVPMVTANGRFFFGYSDQFYAPAIRGEPEPVLIARDAFNGTFLWQYPFPAFKIVNVKYSTGAFLARRTVVAAGDRVYAVPELGKPAIALDAATGKKVMTYTDAGSPEQVIYTGGTLVLVGGGGGPVPAGYPVKGTVRGK